MDFVLYVEGPPELPKPVINNTFAHVIKGESVHLMCTIYSMNGVEDIDLFWDPPQEFQIGRVSTWTDHWINPEFMFEKAVVMTIENVMYKDEDAYDCKAMYLYDEETSQMYLQVHGKYDGNVPCET
ncbi:uncharacterized protein LOC144478037 [Augochlora pura]